jgi:parvulin-like peptidyl-prolyl isomerase
MAKTLGNEGEVSKAFVSKKGDSYYIVKLTGKKDNKVSYESIQVRFTEFNKKIDEIRENNGVKEYIDLSLPDEDVTAPEEMVGPTENKAE